MPVMQHLLVAPRCVSFYTTKAIRGKERIQMCKMYLRNFTRFLCPKMSRISFVRLQAVIAGVEGLRGVVAAYIEPAAMPRAASDPNVSLLTSPSLGLRCLWHTYTWKPRPGSEGHDYVQIYIEQPHTLSLQPWWKKPCRKRGEKRPFDMTLLFPCCALPTTMRGACPHHKGQLL